jgi:2-polyprenyl-3-methyl-5-hydroxy-6-metoxy-1,4-benzoquinol methylase
VTESSFEERYITGETPWDKGVPDINLIDMVIQRPISECRALDVGCGTGDNAIWLAQQHFMVTGCDISDTAIEKAKEKASIANVNCSFIVADFLNSTIPGSPFDFVFDRGCLHSFDTDEERRRFAENAASHLEEGGLWLTVAGNADGQRREIGPPQLTAGEMVAAVEPYFEIISLTAGYIGSNKINPHKAWVCLTRKRKGIQ